MVHRFGDLPEIAGTKSGACVVVSSGHTVWKDLEAAGFHKESWEQNFAVIAVNDVGMHLPCRIDHWYSNDTHSLLNWKEARRPEYKKLDGKIPTHTCMFKGMTDYWWPWPGNGTSSIGAVFTALALGYSEVMVCGVPLDNNGHYFDPPWKKTNFERSGGLRFWKKADEDIFNGRVKVMSGILNKGD